MNASSENEPQFPSAMYNLAKTGIPAPWHLHGTHPLLPVFSSGIPQSCLCTSHVLCGFFYAILIYIWGKHSARLAPPVIFILSLTYQRPAFPSIYIIVLVVELRKSGLCKVWGIGGGIGLVIRRLRIHPQSRSAMTFNPHWVAP